jgi:hypothetical protein
VTVCADDSDNESKRERREARELAAGGVEEAKPAQRRAKFPGNTKQQKVGAAASASGGSGAVCWLRTPVPPTDLLSFVTAIIEWGRSGSGCEPDHQPLLNLCGRCVRIARAR